MNHGFILLLALVVICQMHFPFLVKILYKQNHEFVWFLVPKMLYVIVVYKPLKFDEKPFLRSFLCKKGPLKVISFFQKLYHAI